MPDLLHIERSALNSGPYDRGLILVKGIFVFMCITTFITGLGPTLHPTQCVSKSPSVGVNIPGYEADADIENSCVYPHASRTPSWRGAYTPYEMYTYRYFYLKDKPLEELRSQLLLKCFRMHTEANGKILSRVSD
jgi:hypothetical protein